MIGSTASRPPFPVTLDNWQTAPQIGWTFCHIAEIFPTTPISRGTEPAVPLPRRIEPVADLHCRDADGEPTTVAAIMKATETDGWMVVHDGRILVEEYSGAMEPATLHLLMSVSKSVVGVLVGALVGKGAINVDEQASAYVPELAESGYQGATVRHLLDMRSGIDFSEDYLDPDSGVRLLEQAMGWAPRRSPDVPPTLRGFLLTLQQARGHGGPYEYRSCETDVLGWVCEAAAGQRFPELAGKLIWSRLGTDFDANIGVDPEGTGLFDGGISAALCDLARFGDDDRPRRHVNDQPASSAGDLDRRQLRRRAGLSRGLRVQPGRHPDARWHVSQSVLAPVARPAGAVVSGHPWANDLRRPRDRFGSGQAIELADPARFLEAVLNARRL